MHKNHKGTILGSKRLFEDDFKIVQKYYVIVKHL